MAAAAHSLVIPLAIFRERLGIEEAIELIRLEEDHQVFITTIMFPRCLESLAFYSVLRFLCPLRLIDGAWSKEVTTLILQI